MLRCTVASQHHLVGISLNTLDTRKPFLTIDITPVPSPTEMFFMNTPLHLAIWQRAKWIGMPTMPVVRIPMRGGPCGTVPVWRR